MTETETEKRLKLAEREIERLQAIIDSRPAINAGLPNTYIEWSQSLYELDVVHVRGLRQ